MGVAKGNIQYPPLQLIALTIIMGGVLGMITVQLKKEAIAIDLTEEVNKALVFSGLPLVNVSFEGRDGIVSGVLTKEAQPSQIIEAVSAVDGVRYVDNQLVINEVKPVVFEEDILEGVEDVDFENGLYVPRREHPLEKYSLDKVKFAYSQLTLSEEALPVLDRLAKILAQNSQIHLEISVHTDNQSTALGQIASSQSRADNIRYYLIEKGVTPAQLLAKGYGASRPIAANDTPEGQEKNRRVEIRVLKDR
uniref:OmpA-like domain-containing protein n=1 Tax=uncultured Thiotrichaceae bacterium TaxID=298394 RepID=A0A6S6UKZ1_9GAMM|nr:MAG: Unknown protein [uncultured Thiotrichaceae bacterium]